MRAYGQWFEAILSQQTLPSFRQIRSRSVWDVVWKPTTMKWHLVVFSMIVNALQITGNNIWLAVTPEQCSPTKTNLSISQRIVDHGSLNTFYSIARGISDAVQPGISDSIIKEFKSLLENKDRQQFTTFLEKLATNQKGPIAFFILGIIIAIVSLLFGVVVLVLRCLCSRKHESKKSNETRASVHIICLLFLLGSFVFILIGVIINNQSSPKLFSSIENMPVRIEEVKKDAFTLVENMINTLICFANDTIGNIFDEVVQNVTKASKQLLDDLLDLMGITILKKMNTTAIQERANESSGQCDIINGSIRDLKNRSPNRVCKTKLEKLEEIINPLKNTLGKTKEFVPIKSSIIDNLKEINSSALDLIDTKIKPVVREEIQKKMKEFLPDNLLSDQRNTVDTLMNKINKILRDLTSLNIFKVTKSVSGVLVTIPGVIVLFFIVISALLSSVYLSPLTDGVPKYSRSTNYKSLLTYLAHFSMIGFYTTTILAFFVIILSSIEYLGGSFMSASCKTIKDPTFSVWSNFEQSVKLPTQQVINFSVREVLKQCENDKPLLTAIDANSTLLLNSSLDKALDLSSVDFNLSELINYVKEKINHFQRANTGRKEDAEKYLRTLNQMSTNLNAEFSLEECETLNPVATKNIMNNIMLLKSSIQYFGNETENLVQVFTKLVSLNIDDVIENIRTTLNPDIIKKALQRGADNVHNELLTNLLRCRGLYNLYQNSGTMLCGDLGDPMHGIWASTATL
ncbi:hypothetical protein RB195_007575 [Necator americanus]|uniref:Prominin-1-A-like n=1 Tax=Necator americanus TaxID=51031 RepID=A0ABR1BXY2_NECAM